MNGMTKKVIASVDQHCWDTRRFFWLLVMLDRQKRKGSAPGWTSRSVLAAPRVRTGGERQMFSFPVSPWMALVKALVIWVIWSPGKEGFAV